MKIKISDKVQIISGKYKGKTGKVLKVSKKTNQITVEKINIRTKHIKKREGRKGERIQYEAPFNASNVKIICSHCSKPVRIGYVTGEDGKKRRICKKCHQLFPDEIKAVKKSKSKK